MLEERMNTWLRLQQTLYINCISERYVLIFPLFFLLLFFVVQTYLPEDDLTISCKLLSSGQSQTQKSEDPRPTPVSHLEPPAGRCLTGFCQSSASVSC